MKKDKKVTLFSTIRKAVKEAIAKYKAEMREQVEKHKLLNSKSDWSMIETFIQQCNDNPNLRVEVKLADGTKLTLTTHEEKKKNINDLLEYGI